MLTTDQFMSTSGENPLLATFKHWNLTVSGCSIAEWRGRPNFLRCDSNSSPPTVSPKHSLNGLGLVSPLRSFHYRHAHNLRSPMESLRSPDRVPSSARHRGRFSQTFGNASAWGLTPKTPTSTKTNESMYSLTRSKSKLAQMNSCYMLKMLKSK